MTAVADPPADTIISQPRRVVKFTAYASELVLVHTPTYYVLGPQGQKTGRETEGVRIEFRDGMLEIPEEGYVITAQGRKFPAPELLAWMREHRMNGDHDRGFWEIPLAAPPVTEAEMTAVTDAAVSADIERLRGLLAAEEKGWARGELIRPITSAIERLEEFTAAMREQAEREQAEQTAPSMGELRDQGRELGLSFPPGTTKAAAAEQIAAARAARA